jgi:hypothetical protein
LLCGDREGPGTGSFQSQLFVVENCPSKSEADSFRDAAMTTKENLKCQKTSVSSSGVNYPGYQAQTGPRRSRTDSHDSRHNKQHPKPTFEFSTLLATNQNKVCAGGLHVLWQQRTREHWCLRNTISQLDVLEITSFLHHTILPPTRPFDPQKCLSQSTS